jgi:hypothetical protein
MAKKESEIGEQREQMLDFLVNNLVAKSINSEDGLVELIDYKDQPFLVVPYSFACKDFSGETRFKEVKDNTLVDNDRVNLFRMTAFLLNYISQINKGIAIPEEGLLHDYIETLKGTKIKPKPITPVFILQQANTDFNQVPKENRYDVRVNRGGNFNKQVLGTKFNPKPLFSSRKLSKLELSIWSIYQKTDRQFTRNEENSMKDGFLPCTYVFNPKVGFLQENWYKHMQARMNTDEGRVSVDYRNFRSEPICPSCEVFAEGVDHTACKSTKEYRNYVITRNKARYNKMLKIMDVRKAKDPESRNSVKGIRFEPVAIDQRYTAKLLQGTQKPLYVGIFR